MKMMMIGVMTMNNQLKELFDKQIDFQKQLCLTGKVNAEYDTIGTKDDLDNYKYHLLAMTEELGELVKSDKRWKNLRNKHYDKINKMEELADVFITLINLCIYSGVSYHQLFVATDNKMSINLERIS